MPPDRHRQVFGNHAKGFSFMRRMIWRKGCLRPYFGRTGVRSSSLEDGQKVTFDTEPDKRGGVESR